MAPWDRDDDKTTSTNDRSLHNDEEDNPFIAFRRFADEQFATLVAGINALPDLLSEARSTSEWERRARRTERGHFEDASDYRSVADVIPHDIEQRMMRHSGLPKSCPADISLPLDSSEEARDAARTLILQARNTNVGVDPRRIISLYRDGPLVSPSHYRRWLGVDWFNEDPYSPIQLETHQHTHQHGSMWRAAFEDLLSAQLGKEQFAADAWQGRTNNQSLYSSWAQTGRDWMLGLQCRGVLPPQLPALYQIGAHSPHAMDKIFGATLRGQTPTNHFDAAVGEDFEKLAKAVSTFDQDEIDEMNAKAPQTELDAYEALLENTHNGATGRSAVEQTSQGTSASVAQKTGRSVPADDLSNSKILATLSTTEQTTLPDGTVTTKVILKKRFADGREESTETVSTIQGGQRGFGNRDQAVPETVAPMQGADGQKEQEREKKKSWFWS